MRTKFQIVIQFEGSTDELAELAFQNAVEKIAHGDGLKFREANLLVIDPEVTLTQSISTLRPEDFSNWEGHRKFNEEVAAYNAQLRRPRRLVSRLTKKFYDMTYNEACEIFGENRAVATVSTIIDQLESITLELEVL